MTPNVLSVKPDGERKRQLETDWMDRGRCLGMDPDLFYPEHGVRAGMAKKACASCDVRADCLRYALDRMCDLDVGAFGIWGGMNADERWALRRKGIVVAA